MNALAFCGAVLLVALSSQDVNAAFPSGLFANDIETPVLPTPEGTSEWTEPLQSASTQYLQSNPAPALIDPTALSYSVGKLDGEHIDPRSLQLYWETTDLVIPGNAGFDLEISRSYNKTPYAFQQMGNWVLGLPRLMIPTAPIFLATAYPDNPWLAFFKEAIADTGATGLCDAAPNLIPYDGEYYVTPWQLSIPGDSPRVLMEPNQAVVSGSVPEDAVLLTADNWVAECIHPSDSPKSWGGLGWGGYKVTSPAGMSYHFDVIYGVMPGELGLGTHGGWMELVPSRIEDAHGNFFEFEYVTSLNNRYGYAASQLLYRIVAYQPDGTPDGRAVQFTYDPYFGFDPYNFRNFYGWKHQLSSVWVSDPSTPGQPNTADPREVSYHPEADVFGNTLRSVSLPEGLDWRYDYDADGGRILLPSAVDHSPLVALMEVTVPTGGKVSYDYEHAGQNPGEHWFPTRLSGRRTSGSDVPTGIWSYTYQLSDHLEITTVSGPDRIDEYEFYEGAGTYDLELLKSLMNGGNYDSPLDNGAYMGRLREHRVKALDGTPLQTASTVWDAREEIGLLAYGHQNYGPYNLNSVGYFNARPPVPVLRETISHQTNAVFQQQMPIGHRDTYGHPLRVIEAGINGATAQTTTRTTDYRYFNTVSPWINGLQAEKAVEGYPSVVVDYSPSGLPTKVDRYGIERSYEYHPDGTLAREFWLRGEDEYSISYADYKRGTARSVQMPESIELAFEVADSGVIASKTDGGGAQTRYTHDLLGRLTAAALPDDFVADIAIDYPTANETVLTQADYEQRHYLDSFGRETLRVEKDVSDSSLSVYTRTSYSPAGRVAAVSFPESSSSLTEGTGTAYLYDGLGRLTKRTNLETGSAAQFCYESGCLVGNGYSKPLYNGYGVINERGYLTVLEFASYGDAQQRELTKIAQQSAGPDGGNTYVETVVSRDALSNIVAIEQDGFFRTYSYTAGDLVSRVSHPEALPINYTYDSAANLTDVLQGDRLISLDYDGKNRRTAIRYSDTTPAINISYFPSDYIASVSNGLSQWDYTYSPGGLLLSESLQINGSGFGMYYSYGPRGHLSQLTYPSGYSFSLEPNALGQASQVGTLATDIEWFANGELDTVNLANGLTVSYEQTPDQRLKDISIDALAGQLSAIAYSYDAIGNPVSIVHTGVVDQQMNISYDGLNRLSSSSEAGDFSYSPGGNILSHPDRDNPLEAEQTFTYDSMNRLDVVVDTSFSYDGFGNTLKTGTDTYLYDANNLIKAVSSQPGTTYFYDGNLRRVLSTRAGDVFYSGYGRGGQLLFETNATSGTASEYYYLNGMLVASRDFAVAPSVVADQDGDIVPDYVEHLAGTNPIVADGSDDPDGDGATNLQEFLSGSAPHVRDTDGDGMHDGYEILHGLHSLDSSDAAEDSDDDGLLNLDEFLLGTNPLQIDTDGDGLPDNQDGQPLVHRAAGLMPILNLLLED